MKFWKIWLIGSLGLITISLLIGNGSPAMLGEGIFYSMMLGVGILIYSSIKRKRSKEKTEIHN